MERGTLTKSKAQTEEEAINIELTLGLKFESKRSNRVSAIAMKTA